MAFGTHFLLNPLYTRSLVRLDNRMFEWVFTILLFLIILPLFVPFSPQMPAPGVDPSWALGLNQAVAQGLVFGKDIIFTLGPYSAIYTKMYHPATDSMMLWGSIYLACSYWLALVLLSNKAHWLWVAVFSFFLLTLVYAKDSLLFSYPLLVGILLFRRLAAEQKVLVPRDIFLFALLYAPFGLLSLVKGSLLILCILSSGLSALVLLLHRKYLYSSLSLAVPLGALTGFWCLSGQAVQYIPSYIMSSLLLASSFSEAMSTTGNVDEVLVYLITALVILCLITSQVRPKSLLFFISSLFFIFLFLSFKAGFTRHFGPRRFNSEVQQSC